MKRRRRVEGLWVALQEIPRSEWRPMVLMVRRMAELPPDEPGNAIPLMASLPHSCPECGESPLFSFGTGSMKYIECSDCQWAAAMPLH